MNCELTEAATSPIAAETPVSARVVYGSSSWPPQSPNTVNTSGEAAAVATAREMAHIRERTEDSSIR